MSKERTIVVKIRSRLCHFGGIGSIFSANSTIFMAGKAMKTSITMEKTSVNTISSMFIFHSIGVQSLSLLWFEEEEMKFVCRCYLE